MSRLIELTFTQCKQIRANCDQYGDDWREVVERLQDQPDFIAEVQPLDLYDIKSVNQGGCASGAYMPAVTYYTAWATMNKYHDTIEQTLEDNGLEKQTFNMSEETWKGFSVKLVSLAVEEWCSQFIDYLENVNWE